MSEQKDTPSATNSRDTRIVTFKWLLYTMYSTAMFGNPQKSVYY